MSILMKPSPCPNCGVVHDAATYVSGDDETEAPAQPVPGDLTICIKCGNWSTYDEDLNLTLLSPEQVVWTQTDHMAGLIFAATKTAIEKMKSEGYT